MRVKPHTHKQKKGMLLDPAMVGSGITRTILLTLTYEPKPQNSYPILEMTDFSSKSD